MSEIRAKKHLGQHFLTDVGIAKKIVNSLSLNSYKLILEVGPGTGVLTQFLMEKPHEIHAIELDKESVSFLQSKFPKLSSRLYNQNLLSWKEPDYIRTNNYGLIGNYPYNISTQILFWMLDRRKQIPEMVGMFQKEGSVQSIPRPLDGSVNCTIASINCTECKPKDTT